MRRRRSRCFRKIPRLPKTSRRSCARARKRRLQICGRSRDGRWPERSVGHLAPDPLHRAVPVTAQPPDAERNLEAVDDDAEEEVGERSDTAVEAEAVAVENRGADE